MGLDPYQRSNNNGGIAFLVFITIGIIAFVISLIAGGNTSPSYDPNEDYRANNEARWESQANEGRRWLEEQREAERKQDYKDNSFCIILGEYKRRYVECYAGYTQDAKSRAEAKARECNSNRVAVYGCHGDEAIFY